MKKGGYMYLHPKKMICIVPSQASAVVHVDLFLISVFLF